VIIEGMVFLLFNFLAWLLDLIPEADPPAIVIPGPVVIGYTWLNDVIPVDLFLSGALIYFGAMSGIFTFKVLLLVWRNIPFKGT